MIILSNQVLKLDRNVTEDISYILSAGELLQGITDVDEGDTISITGAVSVNMDPS